MLVASKFVWNEVDHSCMQRACKIRPVNALIVSSVHARIYAWERETTSLFCSPRSLWAAVREGGGSGFSCSWQFSPKKIIRSVSNLAQTAPPQKPNFFFFILSSCIRYIWVVQYPSSMAEAAVQPGGSHSPSPKAFIPSSANNYKLIQQFKFRLIADFIISFGEVKILWHHQNQKSKHKVQQ